jgi:glycosyltransferase involved in cell wall biosynthesis
VNRKNPQAVVRAFQDAFPSGDESAYLLIKTMGADEHPESLETLVTLCSDKRISIRDVKLDRDELIGLVQNCDAFVSLHRSEGFGRSPAEAMLFGKPVIITGYSGTADFATADCAYVVEYSLIPVLPGEYPGVENQRWADADVPQAARYMREIYERPKEAKEVGRLGKERVLQTLSPTVVGQRMIARLEELLAQIGYLRSEVGTRPVSDVGVAYQE